MLTSSFQGAQQRYTCREWDNLGGGRGYGRPRPAAASSGEEIRLLVLDYPFRHKLGKPPSVFSDVLVVGSVHGCRSSGTPLEGRHSACRLAGMIPTVTGASH